MSRVNRAQSLKSPRPQNLLDNFPDDSDPHPPGTSVFSRFFSPKRSSREVKAEGSNDNSRRGSTASTSRDPDPPPPPSSTRLALPRDSLILNAPDSPRRYFMGHQSRGIAVIINNKQFHPSLKLSDRFGTDVDADALEEMFLNLGFLSGNVHRYDDVTKRDMQKLMDYYACQVDYIEMDCFFGVILSHGHENGAIFGNDGMTNLETLLDPFKQHIHPTLVGKPKIFLVQACRGDRFENGVLVQNRHEPDAPVVQRIPLEADFLYAYSTVPGYFSWRNNVKGSWFIEALARNVRDFRADKDMDFLRLLTRVNHDVAYEYQSNVPGDYGKHLKKQMPSIVSMLTKEVYFN